MSPAHAMSSKETVTAKSLPKLASNRSNWIIYKARLEAILEAKGLSRHLTGTAKKPSIPTLGATPTAAEQTAYDEAVEKEEEFITKRGEAKTLILSTTPESMQICIITLSNPKEMWDKVCAEYEKRALMHQIELGRRLQNRQCDDQET